MKRAFDFLFSAILLLCLLPVFLIVALLIKTTSKGPVFYTQKRVGRGNRDFTLFKFRTMIVHSDKKGLLTVGYRDNRITRVGYLLRKYKIDELPQFINVLKGDMSIIGPRPEVRKYVDMYTPQQLKILEVRPGITDYASIEYANENELLSKAEEPEKYYIEHIMPAKLELNQKYLKRPTLWHDFQLVFRTVVVILKKRK